MALEVELAHVQLRGGGRVHFTARVPDSGPAVTLCGKELREGSFAGSDRDADCVQCLKRKDDPARVSSALFEGGMGEALLELSLRKAREGRSGRASTSRTTRVETGKPARKPAARHRPAPAPPAQGMEAAEPPQLGELSLKGLEPLGERVFKSPAGVVIRVGEQGGDWQLEEVSFSGKSLLRRRQGDGFAIELGDVLIQYSVEDRRLRAAFLES